MQFVDLLSFQQLILLFILIAALVLLITERIRVDLTAVLIVVALSATRILEPEEALSGFSSEPAIVVAAVFVLSGGLYFTGLSDKLGSVIGRLAGRSFARSVAVIMLSVAALSAFTHHLTITAIMLPVVLKICRESDISPSRLLMPMSFAASLGTTITIIGAPAFLIADKLLVQADQPGLSIFSISPIGISLSLAGTLFLVLVGRWLLPDRGGSQDEADPFRLEGYFTELIIRPESSMIDKTIEDIEGTAENRFQVSGWLRDGKQLKRPFGQKRVSAGDILLVRTTPDEIAALKKRRGIALRPVVEYGSLLPAAEAMEEKPDELVQAIIAPASELMGRTIASVNFLQQYGVVVVGLWRKDAWLRARLSRIKLREGDVLVLMGSQEAYQRIAADRSFLMLVPFEGEPQLRDRAPLAGLIMVASILAATFSVLPVEITFVAGAALMVLTGCLTLRQAYQSIDTRIFVFVAGIIPLGLAMEKTGLSDLMAGGLERLVGNWSATAILLLLFTASGLLTQVMSDAGTTALLGPVAVALAQAIGLPPQPFVVSVAMAAVASFLSPIGHHGNLLIYGPGRYQFSDFLRVGAPLTLLVAVVVGIVAQMIW